MASRNQQFYQRMHYIIRILQQPPSAVTIINGNAEYPNVTGAVKSQFLRFIFIVVIPAQGIWRMLLQMQRPIITQMVVNIPVMQEICCLFGKAME